MAFLSACGSESPTADSFQAAPHRLASIPAGQLTTVVIEESTCYSLTEHRFDLKGGDPIAIHIHAAYKGGDPSVTGTGDIQLARSVVERLDNALGFYRAASPSSYYAYQIDIRIT